MAVAMDVPKVAPMGSQSARGRAGYLASKMAALTAAPMDAPMVARMVAEKDNETVPSTVGL